MPGQVVIEQRQVRVGDGPIHHTNEAILRRAGAGERAIALLGGAAKHATLDDPYAVARLLDALREGSAWEQVAALLGRDPAAHAALDDRADVKWLLDALWEAGRGDQVRALVGRLPAEGHFDLFRQQDDHQVRYQFGREPDGTPTPPWTRDDLD